MFYLNQQNRALFVVGKGFDTFFTEAAKHMCTNLWPLILLSPSMFYHSIATHVFKKYILF